MSPIYHIGEWYKYPESTQQFKLVEVRKFTFVFECGHWCTDTVFMDMIRVKTGKQVCEIIQLELPLP